MRKGSLSRSLALSRALSRFLPPKAFNRRFWRFFIAFLYLLHSERRRVCAVVEPEGRRNGSDVGILEFYKVPSFILPQYTPFRVYARKSCCSRFCSFFRATHEKGCFLPRLRLELLLNPRSRCKESRSAFDSRVPRSLRMTHSGSRYFYNQPPRHASFDAACSLLKK